jgi:iron-sulfur cluster assembly accessory protein
MFVVLTDNAKKRIGQMCAANNVFAITLGLKGGGCAGYQYDWGVADKELPRHTILDANEGHLMIDKKSLLFLAGTEVDYVEDMFGAQFVLNNPKVKSSCGCGVSVTFDPATTQQQEEESRFQPTW